jgi:hypothetical protein
MYTLAVAAMGRHVKAVDADFKNHAFIRSANKLHSCIKLTLKYKTSWDNPQI